jgi:hypothetical protein
LSTGPRSRFAVTPAQQAALRAALPRRIAAMQAGRADWLAGLKARGEKAPCGRKPRGFDPLLASLNRLDRERAKADARRLERPFRRIMKEAEAEVRRRAVEAQALSERRRIAAVNLRLLAPDRLPDESPEEHALRYCCIVQRQRRDPERFRRELEEMRALVESGF